MPWYNTHCLNSPLQSKAHERGHTSGMVNCVLFVGTRKLAHVSCTCQISGHYFDLALLSFSILIRATF